MSNVMSIANLQTDITTIDTETVVTDNNGRPQFVVMPIPEYEIYKNRQATARYLGTVKDGQIRLLAQSDLPDGLWVIVVVNPYISVQEQERYFTSLSPTEWHKPFDEFIKLSREQPAEMDIDLIEDSELVALVNEVRREQL